MDNWTTAKGATHSHSPARKGREGSENTCARYVKKTSSPKITVGIDDSLSQQLGYCRLSLLSKSQSRLSSAIEADESHTHVRHLATAHTHARTSYRR